MTQVLSLFELFGHCVCMRCQYEPGKLISKCYLSKNCHFMITNWRKSLNSELFRCFFGNRFEMLDLVYREGGRRVNQFKIDINGQWYTNKHDFTSNIFFIHIQSIIYPTLLQRWQSNPSLSQIFLEFWYHHRLHQKSQCNRIWQQTVKSTIIFSFCQI